MLSQLNFIEIKYSQNISKKKLCIYAIGYIQIDKMIHSKYYPSFF